MTLITAYENGVISKTYTLIPPDGRRCKALVFDQRLNATMDDVKEVVAPCGAQAVLCIDIDTWGRKRHTLSRVGFCKIHQPGKYLRWFGLGPTTPTPKESAV